MCRFKEGVVFDNRSIFHQMYGTEFVHFCGFPSMVAISCDKQSTVMTTRMEILNSLKEDQKKTVIRLP